MVLYGLVILYIMSDETLNHLVGRASADPVRFLNLSSVLITAFMDSSMSISLFRSVSAASSLERRSSLFCRIFIALDSGVFTFEAVLLSLCLSLPVTAISPLLPLLPPSQLTSSTVGILLSSGSRPQLTHRASPFFITLTPLQYGHGCPIRVAPPRSIFAARLKSSPSSESLQDNTYLTYVQLKNHAP